MATKLSDRVFYSFETGEPVPYCEGVKVLQPWPLN
jgi:hypothetical protein